MKKLIIGMALASAFLVNAQNKNVDAQVKTLSKVALDAYNNKNYALAAPKFMEVYNLMKNEGKEEKVYLYYAGLNYAMAQNNTEALKIYEELYNSGFTGIETEYVAKNKKTNEVEAFDKSTWELLKKSSDFTDFKTQQTPGYEEDIYNAYSVLLLNAKRNEDALQTINKGLQKFPKSERLIALKSNALLQTGKTDDLVDNLKLQAAGKPNDPDTWYNLGVLLSKDPAKEAEAEEAYKKAVALKPDYASAWQNLTFLAIGDDEKARDDYKAAQKAKNNELAGKIMEMRKSRFVKALPYAEKWYEVDSKSRDAVETLHQLYMLNKNTEKAAEFKAKLEAMK